MHTSACHTACTAACLLSISARDAVRMRVRALWWRQQARRGTAVLGACKRCIAMAGCTRLRHRRQVTRQGARAHRPTSCITTTAHSASGSEFGVLLPEVLGPASRSAPRPARSAVCSPYGCVAATSRSFVPPLACCGSMLLCVRSAHAASTARRSSDDVDVQPDAELMDVASLRLKDKERVASRSQALGGTPAAAGAGTCWAADRSSSQLLWSWIGSCWCSDVARRLATACSPCLTLMRRSDAVTDAVLCGAVQATRMAGARSALSGPRCCCKTSSVTEGHSSRAWHAVGAADGVRSLPEAETWLAPSLLGSADGDGVPSDHRIQGRTSRYLTLPAAWSARQQGGHVSAPR